VTLKWGDSAAMGQRPLGEPGRDLPPQVGSIQKKNDIMFTLAGFSAVSSMPMRKRMVVISDALRLDSLIRDLLDPGAAIIDRPGFPHAML
jgi:hypothetical protein